MANLLSGSGLTEDRRERLRRDVARIRVARSIVERRSPAFLSDAIRLHDEAEGAIAEAALGLAVYAVAAPIPANVDAALARLAETERELASTIDYVGPDDPFLVELEDGIPGLRKALDVTYQVGTVARDVVGLETPAATGREAALQEEARETAAKVGIGLSVGALVALVVAVAFLVR